MTDVEVLLWGDVSYPILVGHRHVTGFEIKAVVGTGFVPLDGVLVTCWHCVKGSAQGLDFALGLRPANGASIPTLGIENVEADAGGLDLATASVELAASPLFNLCPDRAVSGHNVWSAGFPLPKRTVLSTGQGVLNVQPRQLKGYITCEFDNPDHPGFGSQPSYELDMLSPAGMSGSPLMIDSIAPVGLRLVGVIYGSRDAYTIADEARVDEETSGVSAEVRRYVSFGASHSWESVGQLRGTATGARPLAELLPRAPNLPS